MVMDRWNFRGNYSFWREGEEWHVEALLVVYCLDLSILSFLCYLKGREVCKMKGKSWFRIRGSSNNKRTKFDNSETDDANTLRGDANWCAKLI